MFPQIVSKLYQINNLSGPFGTREMC